jgi:hypothetical protein
MVLLEMSIPGNSVRCARCFQSGVSPLRKTEARKPANWDSFCQAIRGLDLPEDVFELAKLAQLSSTARRFFIPIRALKRLAPRATTHWAALDRLGVLDAEPTRPLFVESGKVITAAGVSAGIDMALTLAAKVAGQAFAEGLPAGYRI